MHYETSTPQAVPLPKEPELQMSKFLVGADECGLGSLAGPLLCCAVAVPADWVPPPGLNDSKKLTKAKREKLYNILRELPRALSWVSAAHIDIIGIRTAVIAAHTNVIQEMLALHHDAEVILDGDVTLPELPQVRCVPHADAIFAHVMAASVIAKVTRDWEMARLDKEYKGYAFAKNAGYGTPEHLQGLAKHGASPLHRKSFEPIKTMVAKP